MSMVKLAAAQFRGTADWQENLKTCLAFIADAVDQGVDLLVLPEAAFRTRQESQDAEANSTKELQPLTGPFVQQIVDATRGTTLTVVVGTVEMTFDPRPSNTLVAAAEGEIRAVYRKIHLYDAFSRKESERVLPGDGPLSVFQVKGFNVGMMTCYDVRFPEAARALAVRGADIIALPASWVAGPHKEAHWQVMTQARALENTCFVVAAGKTGPTRIGMSAVIDPLGIVRAQLGGEEGMLVTTASRDELESTRLALPLLQQRRIRTELDPLPAAELSASK
ncbi:carbon-nitrogen hydrolase family protein [Streptomyces albidus (ex Kaewkla and Franco 2022)]|uniref:carbon-nitrogen hydrolase family protein n=1 Tax=Streptomyces albidus (ex Kaewkla and Franco 2022) TaxID=722709 RepID=UPI0015EE761D|nr:carbon-nitrogen hydrolase family protein [Streptomyces albidus (ex Kaewkla and Franco 2022)]